MAILKSALARFRDLRPAFVETVLFLAAGVAIDTIFLDGSRYSTFSQHPFWAIVLLTTVQYGTRAGLLATCLASFALLAGNLPPHTLTQDGFAWMAQVTTLPLLWFLASVVLGELRVRQIRVSEDLREKLTSSQEREHVLTEAYQRISSVRQTLEARVAGQLHTSVSIHEAARGIEKLDASEVLLGIPGLIKAVINPKQFSVFLIRKDALEISLREGWTEDSVYPVRYGSDSELFREVIGSCRFPCRANKNSERLLKGHGVLAGPLINSHDGQVLGMIKIEELGFLDLNLSNVEAFRAVCQWIGTAYGNALRYQKSQSDAIVSGETDLLSYGFLSRQMSVFTKLAQRIGFDVSLVIVEISNYDRIAEEARPAVAAGVGRCVSRALRNTDLTFDYLRTGAEFAIILPGTTENQAQLALAKLRRALDQEFAGSTVSPDFVHRVQVLHQVEARSDVEALAKALA